MSAAVDERTEADRTAVVPGQHGKRNADFEARSDAGARRDVAASVHTGHVRVVDTETKASGNRAGRSEDAPAFRACTAGAEIGADSGAVRGQRGEVDVPGVR